MTSSNVRKPGPEDKCAFCGCTYEGHRNGFCYHYSDESEDYFYTDKKFTRNEPAMEKEIEKLAEEYTLKNAIGVIDGLGLNEAFIAGFKAGLTRNEAITSELVECLKDFMNGDVSNRRATEIKSLITKAKQL